MDLPLRIGVLLQRGVFLRLLRFHGRRLVLLPRPRFTQLLADLGNVTFRLAVRRDVLVLEHSAFAGIVGSQRQAVVVEQVLQVFEVFHARFDILLGIEAVGDAEAPGRRGDQLHQPLRSLRRQREAVVVALHFNHRVHQQRIDVVRPRALLNHRPDRVTGLFHVHRHGLLPCPCTAIGPLPLPSGPAAQPLSEPGGRCWDPPSPPSGPPPGHSYYPPPKLTWRRRSPRVSNKCTSICFPYYTGESVPDTP